MEQVTTLLSIILGSGLIIQFMFYRHKKRKQKAEADMSEFDAKVNEIKHFSEQLKEAYAEIDKMQDIINGLRSSLIDMSRALSEARIELVKEGERRVLAEYNLCTVQNCTQRTPPRNHKQKHEDEQRTEKQ